MRSFPRILISEIFFKALFLLSLIRIFWPTYNHSIWNPISKGVSSALGLYEAFNLQPGESEFRNWILRPAHRLCSSASLVFRQTFQVRICLLLFLSHQDLILFSLSQLQMQVFNSRHWKVFGLRVALIPCISTKESHLISSQLNKKLHWLKLLRFRSTFKEVLNLFDICFLESKGNTSLNNL